MKEFETPTIEVVSLSSVEVLSESYMYPLMPFDIPDTFDVIKL